MSIFIVRNGKKLNRIKPQIGSIELDASIQETHSFRSTVPQYPVESGATVSDNVVNEPAEIEIRGIVSVVGGDEQRADDAFRDLLTLRDKREPVEVITSARRYENMILESLTVPRDQSTGESLVFTARLREIQLADVQVVTIDDISSVQSANLKSAPVVKTQEEQDFLDELEFRIGDVGTDYLTVPQYDDYLYATDFAASETTAVDLPTFRGV